MSKTRITAAFAIHGGGYDEFSMNIDGLTPDEIAELVFDVADVNVTLCHQCARNISDPEIADLVEFTVDGVDYVKIDNHWVATA